jgi:hypothetical protein
MLRQIVSEGSSDRKFLTDQSAIRCSSICEIEDSAENQDEAGDGWEEEEKDDGKKEAPEDEDFCQGLV